MTDKGQVENGGEGDGHVVAGEPRSVGGPATGGSGASPETAPPVEMYSDPDATSSESPAAPHLPPVFEAPPPRVAEAESHEIQSALEKAPAGQSLHQDSSSPAFTSAAHELFFPRDSDDAPTYQTREHSSYGGQRTTPVDTGELQQSERERRKARAIELFWIAARYAGYAAVGYLALVLLLVLVFRFVNPPASSLMLWQWMTGNSVNRTWVPINRISPSLIRAVVVAEDGRFCDHAGIDFRAIGEAIQQASDGVPRGASTISMQVTKNMFLWSSRSYIRKIVELPLTLVMELVWPKWRILEVYLNIAEWGPGIFGAEAASRYHFHQSAARLGERQAALLAATLPNPIIREAGDPSTLVSRKARVIQARMRSGSGAAACVLSRM